MVIFLTGGTGFIGKRFIKLALQNGHFIFAVSRKKKNNKKKLKWLRGEINDDWSKFLRQSNIIVHLAAKGVRELKSENSYEVINFNVRKSFDLISLAIKNNCKKFIIASTSSEYANNGISKNKLSKKSKRSFSSIYSLSKIVFTDIIEHISKKTNSKFRIMRIFPTFGIGENKKRLFPTIRRLAKSGKNMNIKNPNEVRDFTDVNYVAKVLLDSCNFNTKKKFEIFHVSSNNTMSVLEFSKKIWKKYQAKGQLKYSKKIKRVERHISHAKSNWKLKYEK